MRFYQEMKKITYMFVSLVFVQSCFSNNGSRSEKVAKKYCTSCHLFPVPELLPKKVWSESILPQMAYHLGIGDPLRHPTSQVSMAEALVIRSSGWYPDSAQISEADWQLINQYYLEGAPDSLLQLSFKFPEQLLFSSQTISLDSTKQPLVSMLHFDEKNNELWVGTAHNELLRLHRLTKSIPQFSLKLSSTPTGMVQCNQQDYALMIGQMAPNDRDEGRLIDISNNKSVLEGLRRPVQILNLNNTKGDIAIAEFGHHRGALSLIDSNFQKRILLNRPGALKMYYEDLDLDGKKELITLFGQGDEAVISCIEVNDSWDCQALLRFHPLFGSSDMDIQDINGDGFLDILIASGDNADYSIIAKPYHGIYIYYNDGAGHFGKFDFLAMNGCTNIEVADFDLDGDQDIMASSFFPEPQFDGTSSSSLVYYNNEGGRFKAYDFTEENKGSWLVMTKADVDLDGDQDIILGSFMIHPRNKRPDKLIEDQTSSTDLLILLNKKK